MKALKYINLSEDNIRNVSPLLSAVEPVPWDEFRVKKSTLEDEGYIPELMFLAYRQDRCVGYFLGTGRGNDGYIKHMAVIPELRKAGLGTEILSEGEERMRKAGMKKIVAGASPRNYFRLGIEINERPALCFFIKNGYTSNYIAAMNMTVNLDEIDYDTRKEEKEITDRDHTLKRFEEKYRDKVISQVKDDSWRGSILNSLVYPGAGTYFYEDKTGRITGYACYGLRGANHFGPIWVTEELRRTKLGIGKVLGAKVLHALKENGNIWAEIIWIGPIRFYVKTFNAKIGRVFFMFEKILKDG